MLPTSGLFKDIDCPYYDNYCGRPYCHFRHRKRNPDSAEDSQDGDMASVEYPTYKPTPKSQLAQAKSHIPISYVPDTVVRPERLNRIPSMYSYMEKITYKPTPLSELSKNNAINTTAELINKELFSKIGDKKGLIDLDSPEPKDNGNCHIDFEELSVEFEMIDDIISETPSQENDEEKSPSEKSKEHNSTRESNKSSHSSSRKTSKNSHATKESSASSKHKDDKSSSSSTSKHSKSSNSHKSSHKSKSDHHHHHQSRSRSREKSSSDSKHKDDKKRERDKDHKSSSSSSSTTTSKEKKASEGKTIGKEKHRKSADSKHGSGARSGSKHREDDKSRRKEQEKSSSSRDKSRKESKSASSKSIATSAPQSISDSDREGDDIFSEDLVEECYRIFNEYKPEPVEKLDFTPVDAKQEAVEEYVPTTKKRVAHVGADQYTGKLSHTKLKPSQNAAMQMSNRYKIMRDVQATQEDDDIVAILDKHAVKRHPTQILETYKNMKRAKMKHDEMREDTGQSTSLVDDIINGKGAVTYKPTPISKLNAEEAKSKPLRIAPAMNVSSIQQAKARIAEMAKKKEALAKTPIQTVGKGNKRVAHIPDSSLGELPDVLNPENKKIPVNVRTRYLVMVADECVKLYQSREDAYDRAVNEEFKVFERCAAIVTYRNAAMLAVNRIRREGQDREAKGLGPIGSGESGSSSDANKLRGKRFYENVLGYVLKEEELVEHGYPREGPVPGRAVAKAQKQLPRVNLDDNQRLCCRCFKVYLVDKRGFPLYPDDCIYHPLKRRTLRGERVYLCCKSGDDTGCLTSNAHVSESDESELLGYQTTMDPEIENDPRSSAVYALDCEMCYTTKGLELTRVTIIDHDCKTIYESLVKPLNPIIDYNTQFSGITKEQMDRTSTSILQVQANILHLCNSKTILIGHSLESDMKALKIVHGCVIDTSILFPHRLGLPHKRALRNLASEYLNKIIQSDVAGHDSAEDAITCMELVLWKLKEDLKVKGFK